MTEIDAIKNAQRLYHIIQAIARIRRSVDGISKESLSVVELFAKLLHNQYGYVVTMTVDAPVEKSSGRAISPRVRVLRGIAKSPDNRPYKDILADAIAERYEAQG